MRDNATRQSDIGIISNGDSDSRNSSSSTQGTPSSNKRE
jgi:hypothetical protein